MPTTVVEIYRDLPGASAHHIWDEFAQKNGGIYLIGGSSYTGKSKFAEKTAVEAAKYLKITGKEFVIVDFENQKSTSINYLSYPNEPARTSTENRQKSNDEYVQNIVSEVLAKNVKIAVVDEIRSRQHAEVVARLAQFGVIVFAVFRSCEKTTILHRFSDAISSGDDVETVEYPVHLAFLSLVYTQNTDHIRREGFVEYYEGTVNLPANVKAN